MIVVSRCLLGENCRYNGGNNYHEKVVAFLKGKTYLAVCPEQAGGLSTPRMPCERYLDKVINQLGEDQTEAFYLGSKICIEKLKNQSIEMAILKAKSPSCGKGCIYDGTFQGRLIKGNGVFAQALLDLNIPVINEDEIDIE